jgi:hypothetical protein
MKEKSWEKKYFIFQHKYDPLTVTHLFQRFFNKAMPSKKTPLISLQKISLALLSGIHPKKNPLVFFF